MSELSNDEMAARLLCLLSEEVIEKSDLFDYVCWLEESGQKERVLDAQCLCMASDGFTCWGDTYEDAIRKAFKHDRELYEAVKKFGHE